MSKPVQVGYVSYITGPEPSAVDLARYMDVAAEGLIYTALLNRLIVPPPNAVRAIYHPPDESADHLGNVVSIGYKAWSYRLPWYKGWLTAAWAWWHLRRLSHA